MRFQKVFRFSNYKIVCGQRVGNSVALHLIRDFIGCCEWNEKWFRTETHPAPVATTQSPSFTGVTHSLGKQCLLGLFNYTNSKTFVWPFWFFGNWQHMAACTRHVQDTSWGIARWARYDIYEKTIWRVACKRKMTCHERERWHQTAYGQTKWSYYFWLVFLLCFTFDATTTTVASVVDNTQRLLRQRRKEEGGHNQTDIWLFVTLTPMRLTLTTNYGINWAANSIPIASEFRTCVCVCVLCVEHQITFSSIFVVHSKI